MGVPFSIDPGVGPIIPDPVRTAVDVERLRVVDAEEATPYLFTTIRELRRELDGSTALIGFAGAPYTVASYLIEGRPTRDFARVKAMMYGEPETWHRLMAKLAEVMSRYLRAQVDAGVQVVQLFDSWAGSLSREEYMEYVQPYSARIFSAISVQPAADGVAVVDNRVPTIHFGTGTPHLLEEMAAAGGHVVSVDWRVPLDEAWRRIGFDKGIQGNLEPAVLLAPWEVIEREARKVLRRAAGRPGHIFNLGHGVLAETPADSLKRLVELVHAETIRADVVVA
jgi:uroporphyrinogen decarboxylase